MARTGPRQKQMGVALPDGLRGYLDIAAEETGHSVAEEIRRRLESTVRDDQRGPALRDLFNDIDYLAGLVSDDSGVPWDGHPVAFAIFRAAVLALVDLRKPKGDAVLRPGDNELFGGRGIADGDDPDTIGRALVRHLVRVKRERAKEGLQRQKGEPDGSKET